MAAAKKLSQVAAHMAIAFAIAYGMTGSVVCGGLAVIIEPVINVMLLPHHQAAWTRFTRSARTAQARYLMVVSEKLSQTALHAGVAFAVMYFATGSLAFGGMAALLEPVCNVLLLPFHDRIWDNLASRRSLAAA